MATWLYPISSEHRIARKTVSCLEDWQSLVRSRKLLEDTDWGVKCNFEEVTLGDEVYVYLAKGGGLVGCGIVDGKFDKSGKRININFDFEKCEKLIQNPNRSKTVDFIRKNVGNLRQSLQRLEEPRLTKLRWLLGGPASGPALAKGKSAFPRTSFQPEFFGQRTSYRLRGQIQSEAKHGEVVNALRNVLKGKSAGRVCNDQARDLYILRSNRQMHTLFEAKADLATRSVYEAIGQVIYNSAELDPTPKRVLVLPGKPSVRTQGILRRIGIATLRYEWDNGRPRFINLNEVLKN